MEQQNELKQKLKELITLSEQYEDVKRRYLRCADEIEQLFRCPVCKKNVYVWLKPDEIVSTVGSIRVKCLSCPLDTGKMSIEQAVEFMMKEQDFCKETESDNDCVENEKELTDQQQTATGSDC